jgi:diguanylate cyclase (GGDEF)-like protein
MGLRVVIALSYVVLIRAGLLPMSTAWWIASGWSLLVYAIAMLVTYHRFGLLRLHSDVTPFTDTLMVTLAIVALARPDYPIWIGYFLIITSLATFYTTRYMAAFALWTIALYWCGLLILDASGRAPIDWQIATIVSIMATFTALNADVISTSNRKLREMVRKAAHTDPLTGLDNRRRFREILESHGAGETRPLAVLMYDLDNFKVINEEYGHVRADAVLVRVADELRAAFREADTVARYGGDEIVVLAHVLSLDHAIGMAERSLVRIKEQTGVTMSAGISVYPFTSNTLDGALRGADAALGVAKRGGKARVAASPARGAA